MGLPRTVRIKTEDGTLHGAEIVDAKTGAFIHGVTAIEISGTAKDGPLRAKLDIMLPQLEVGNLEAILRYRPLTDEETNQVYEICELAGLRPHPVAPEKWLERTEPMPCPKCKSTIHLCSLCGEDRARYFIPARPTGGGGLPPADNAEEPLPPQSSGTVWMCDGCAVPFLFALEGNATGLWYQGDFRYHPGPYDCDCDPWR